MAALMDYVNVLIFRVTSSTLSSMTKNAVEHLEVPRDMSAEDQAVFKQGALGGLRLASMGYWLDVDKSAPTIH